MQSAATAAAAAALLVAYTAVVAAAAAARHCVPDGKTCRWFTESDSSAFFLLILLQKSFFCVCNFFLYHRPVQTKHLKFCQPRISHATATITININTRTSHINTNINTRVSHIWYHTDRHELWKRVTATFLVQA